MTALRKLPRYTGMTLYRGVRSGVKMDKDHYCKGSIITWSALSSTSPDMNAIKGFLSSDSEGGSASGVLFIIEDGWGYDVQPYSLYPDDAEILLEPEREFMVQDVIDADVTIVKLKMLDTPVILPEMFGDDQP